MMVTHYAVRCDTAGCDRVGPSSTSRGDAWRLAQREGFSRDKESRQHCRQDTAERLAARQSVLVEELDPL